MEIKINKCVLAFDVCEHILDDCNLAGIARQEAFMDGIIPIDLETAKYITNGTTIDFSSNDIEFIFDVHGRSIWGDTLVIFCTESNSPHKGCGNE